MAITDINISEELQTNAPSIKYRGNEGPKSPEEEMQMADALLREEYDKYVYDLLEQRPDATPMSFEEFRMMVIGEGRAGVAEGGRPGYGLGSLIKKITRPVKKVLGSPIGKAAAAYGLGTWLGGMPGFGGAGGSLLNRLKTPSNILNLKNLGGWKQLAVGKPGVSLGGNLGRGAGLMSKGTSGILGAAGKLSPWKAMTAASLIPFTGMGMGKKESLGDIAGMDDLKFDFNYDDMIAEVKAAVSSGDVEEIKRVNLKYGLDLVEDVNVYAAEGGRIKYYKGGLSIPSENTMEDARKTAMQDRLGGITEVMKQADLYRQGDVGQMYMNQGGRIGYADAGKVFASQLKPSNSDIGISSLLKDKDFMINLITQLKSEGKSSEEIINQIRSMVAEPMAPVTPRKEIREPFYPHKSEGIEIREPFYPDRFEGKEIREPFYPDRFEGLKPQLMAEGGPTQEGGIMDLGGMEKDYRNTGGFVDLGAEEKADDVPARLSVNEFVMTADAVRGAGGGDIDKGAKRMEDLMEKLESKGKKENMKMAGGGERGWKAQMRAMEIAEEEYGKDFYDLNDALQHKIYNRALQEIDDMLMGRKGASDMFEVSERLSAVV